MPDLSTEQVEYILQFQHPEKMLAHCPGVSPAVVAEIFDIPPGYLAEVHARFEQHAAAAAEQSPQRPPLPGLT